VQRPTFQLCAQDEGVYGYVYAEYRPSDGSPSTWGYLTTETWNAYVDGKVAPSAGTSNSVIVVLITSTW
jgi:hypothetical protein